jgi:hypothetical protein
MSETNVAFAPAAPDVTTGGPGADGGGPSTSNRRRTMALAVVAVLLLAALGYFLLFRHSSSGNSSPQSFVPHGTTRTTQHHHHRSGAASVLPATYNGVVGRDPFRPLVQPAPSKAPGSGSQSSSGTGSQSSTQSSSGTQSTSGTGSKTVSGQSPTVFQPIWIELVSVGKGLANFRVAYANGTYANWSAVPVPKTGGKASLFGNVFELLAVQNNVATVVMGDGAPFQVQPGFANRHLL